MKHFMFVTRNAGVLGNIYIYEFHIHADSFINFARTAKLDIHSDYLSIQVNEGDFKLPIM